MITLIENWKKTLTYNSCIEEAMVKIVINRLYFDRQLNLKSNHVNKKLKILIVLTQKSKQHKYNEDNMNKVIHSLLP